MSYSNEDTYPTSTQFTEPGGQRMEGSGSTTSGRDLATTQSMRTSQLLDRIVQGAHHTVDRLAETAAPKVQRLQAGVASVRERGGELREGVRNTVRRNPLVALAIALGVGMLIGGRRTSR